MHTSLDQLPRIKTCENKGQGTCRGRIERNHALIIAGKRLNEPYAIRALCTGCHRGNNGTIHKRADLICKINAITEGLDHLKATYPKTNWDQELKRYQFQFKAYV